MASRALFVGLGGTGGVALAFTRAQLQARLRAANWSEGFPEHAWRFIHIDVPPVTDIDDRLSKAEAGDALALGARTFRGREYGSLVEPGDRYDHLDRRACDDNAAAALAGWRRADPQRITVPIEKGAGQYRAVGALVSVARRGDIVKHLTSAHETLDTQFAVEEAQRISVALGSESDLAREKPYVFIITSMVGGAGAGLYLDVASNARALFGAWVAGFMVAPEGFDLDEIGTFAPANTWGLMSELQYLIAAADGDHDVEVAAARFPRPGTAPDSAMATARGLYVLGRSNQQVTLGGEAAVEKVIAETLASIVTSDAALNAIIRFGLVNRTPEAQTDKLGFGPSCGFRSLGFGRLELGRGRFSRYLHDRLTGLVGRRIASLDLHRQTTDDGTREQLADAIARVAKEIRYTVAADAGLRELDTATASFDQVLDALRPDQSPHWSGTEAEAAAGHDDVAIGTYKERLVQWARERFHQDRPTWHQQLNDRVRAWQARVQPALLHAVGDVVGRHGLPVAAEVLALVHADLLAAAEQLRRDARTLRDLDPQALLGEVVPPSYTGMVTAEQRTELAGTMSEFLRRRFEGLARDAAADACHEAATHLVRPCQQALERAIEEIRDPRGEWHRDLELLPTDGDPAAYRARPYEILIDDVDAFPDIFDEQITTTVKIDERASAHDEAVRQIVVDRVQHWLIVEGNWQPGRIGPVESVPAPLRCRVSLTPTDVGRQVAAWVRRPEYPLREYLSEGLRSFVEGGRPNRDRLRDALTRLVMVAGPLAKTNKLVEPVHGETTGLWAFTEFPFAGDSEAQREARAAVEETMARATDARFSNPSWIQAERDAIELLTEEGPYQALCFETLMGPIRSLWREATLGMNGDPVGEPTGLYGKIGLQRHALPLSMSGPLPWSKLVDLCTGYVLEKARGNLTPTGVADPRTGREAPFPRIGYPASSEFREFHSHLGRIIENMKVAYVEASQDGLRSLRAYQILVEAGSDARTAVRQCAEHRDEIQRLCDRIDADVRASREPSLELREPSTDVWELRHVLQAAVTRLRRALEEAETWSEEDAW